MLRVQVIKVPREGFTHSDKDIHEVYDTIGLQTDPSVIQRYLYDIIMYERETIKLIDHIDSWRTVAMSTVRGNFILNEFLDDLGVSEISQKELGSLIGKYMSPSVRRSINTLLGIDSGFIEDDYIKNPMCSIISVNGHYIGHVYAWPRSNRLEVQGIRTSILNVLRKSTGKNTPGIAPVLIDSIVRVAKMKNYSYVVVLEPYEVMKPVLKEYGFKLFNMRGDYVFKALEPTSKEVREYTLISSV